MSLRCRTTTSRHVLPVLFVFALALGGCSSDKPAENRGAVSWPTLVSFVRTCNAKRVEQTHSRLVTLTLRDGRKPWAREPRIDAIIPVVNHADGHCGPITFATE